LRFSLDTHIFLWAVTGDDRLPATVADALLQVDADVYVSAVCVWEAAIKSSLGRLSVEPARLVGAVQDSGFTELPITAAHAAATAGLEPLHRDPFDRLLIAQARVEGLTLVTVDAQVRVYNDVPIFPDRYR
jgi:PIN domain nuclease of toxin-antitoxin system